MDDLSEIGHILFPNVIYMIAHCDTQGKVGIVPQISNRENLFLDLDTVNHVLSLLPKNLATQTFVLKFDLTDGKIYRMYHVYNFKYLRAKDEFAHWPEVQSSDDCEPYVLSNDIVGFEISDLYQTIDD